MHTRNVNVKTAAQESSRKMGEKPCRTRSSSLRRKKTLRRNRTFWSSAAFPVAVLLSLHAIITGVLLVNFLSCSSVMAITQKQDREMAPFGSRPALLSGRRAPLRQGCC